MHALYPYRLSNTAEDYDRLVHNERGILLMNALLDTSKSNTLAIPDGLRAPANNGSYIVQAKGAVDDSFRASLAAVNATIVSYIPNNAFLVRVSEAGAQQLSADARTQSVLPYEPYYKLEPSLLKLAVEQPGQLPGNGALNVTLFPDVAEAGLTALQAAGAQVVAQDRTPFGSVVKVYATSGTLAQLASLPAVEGIAAWHARRVSNDLMRPTLGVSPNSTSAGNNLGLTGANIQININDTGVNAVHPDLSGRITADNGSYLADTDGHGTHVAGTILGSGTKSSTLAGHEPQGSVSGANFRGMAFGAKAFVNNYNNSDSYLQERASEMSNFISNNSWNYANGGYDIFAASYDAAVRDAQPNVTGSQPLLFVFSAGNEGGGYNDGTGGYSDSIQSPATAKNVITVGAIEQPRYIEYVSTNMMTNAPVTNDVFYTQTDSSGQVADFSSRGNVGIFIEGMAGRFKPDVVAPGTFVVSCRSRQFDEASYYNPSNYNTIGPVAVTIPTNTLFTFPPVLIPPNVVAVKLFVQTNALSPTNLPVVPIYGVLDTFVTTNSVNFLGTNSIVLPTNALTLNSDSSIYFGIYNTNALKTLPLDVTIVIITTNDNTDLLVLSNLNNNLKPWYRYESGTSMAAAGVSGMLACMQEYFEQRLHMTNSPALMKALLINGARNLGQLYDFGTMDGVNSQGWGLPDLTNSTPGGFTSAQSAVTTLPMLVFDQSPTNALATGQSQSYQFTVSTNNAGQDVRVTLVWTDPPGNPNAGPKLVNDLDLIVTDPNGNVYYGNDIPVGSLYNEMGFTNAPILDSVNNVENVYLQSPGSGTYIVTVLGRRVNVNAVTMNNSNIVQDFALVISSGDGGGVVSPVTLSLPVAPITTNLLATTPGITNLFFLTNGYPYDNRVGANSQFAPGSNGVQAQWNFYVYTNTSYLTNPNFTNIAIAIFAAPNLGVPRIGALDELAPPTNAATRNLGADVDLYVSTDSNLTNLNSATIAGCFAQNLVSVGRTGYEHILITNSTIPVYYIGVKSEDQQAAQYSLFAEATDQSFNQTDANGNVHITMLPVPPPFPLPIPGGSPEQPQHSLILGFTTSTVAVRKAVVTNTVTSINFGDLIGTLSLLGGTNPTAVLDNHTYFTNTSDATETFVYDDTGEDPTARRSDGPGTLRNFAGASANGIWMFTLVNDSDPTSNGVIQSFQVLVYPQIPTNSYSGIIPTNSWAQYVVDVTAFATNLTVSVSQTGANSQLLDLSVDLYDEPPYGELQAYKVIAPPGGSVSINKFSSPPLNPGRYFIGIYNGNLLPQGFNLSIEASPSMDNALTNLMPSVYYATAMPTNSVPINANILDDAVTDFPISVTNNSPVASVEVGVRIDHPRISDLVLTLVSPQGTRVLLSENRGGANATNYGNANYNNVSNLVYATFTENTNITTLPIKFAVPPFGAGASNIPAVTLFTDSFEGIAAIPPVPYLGLIDSNFSNVGTGTNPGVMIVTVPALAANGADGSNVLALHQGAIFATLPTVAGRNYSLTFSSHGKPDLSPVGWWKGDGNANDSSGIMNDGSFADSYTNGIVNQAFFLNPAITTYDYKKLGVKIPENTNLYVLTNSLSIEGWIQPLGAGQFIFCRQDIAGNTPYGLSMLGDNTLEFDVNDASGNDAYVVVQIPYSQWIYVAATLDGVSGKMSLYTNGILASSTVTTVRPEGILPGDNFPGGNSAGLAIGNSWQGIILGGNDSSTFNGYIDEISLYNYALTPAQIQDIYAAGSVGKCLNTVDPDCSVSANIIFGNNTNSFSATDNWSSNVYNFTAPINNLTLTIIPSTNSTGAIEGGMLLDDFQLIQTAIVNPSNYYLPEEPLSKVNGESAMGNWNLEVLDNRVGPVLTDLTNLLSWSLSLQLADITPFPATLMHHIPQTNSVDPNNIVYYQVNVPPWAQYATNILTANGPLTLLFNQTTEPTTTSSSNFTLANYTTLNTPSLITLSNSSSPILVSGTNYFLGVQNSGSSTVTFTIEVDFDITTLTNAIPVPGVISNDTVRYFQFTVDPNQIATEFQILNPSGTLELVVSKGPPLPTAANYAYASDVPNSPQNIIVVTNSTPVPLSAGLWYLGVTNNSGSNVSYSVVATETGTLSIIYLTNGVPYTGIARPGPSFTNFFAFVVTNNPSGVLFELYQLNGNAELTMDFGAYPYAPPFTANTVATNIAQQIVAFTNGAASQEVFITNNLNGTYYLGVPNPTSSPVTYTIRASLPGTNGYLLPEGGGTVTVTVIPGQGPVLSIPAVTGYCYILQYSSDLVTWYNEIGPIPATGPIFTVQDTLTPLPSIRFYRIVQVICP